MTAPVDVLAVMDAACKLHAEGAYADAWEVELTRIAEVRAAVAELIEAAAAEHARAARPLCGAGADSYDRLAAALARVGGA